MISMTFLPGEGKGLLSYGLTFGLADEIRGVVEVSRKKVSDREGRCLYTPPCPRQYLSSCGGVAPGYPLEPHCSHAKVLNTHFKY